MTSFSLHRCQRSSRMVPGLMPITSGQGRGATEAEPAQTDQRDCGAAEGRRQGSNLPGKRPAGHRCAHPPLGDQAFIVNYRAGNGGRKAPNKRVSIGRVTVDRARKLALNLLGQVAGADPATRAGKPHTSALMAASRAVPVALPQIRQAPRVEGLRPIGRWWRRQCTA